jgi:uncharacterized membrane-anchored protein YhcB (DUF1043 family)
MLPSDLVNSLQTLQWVIGILVVLVLGALGFIYNHFEKRSDKMDQKIDNLESKIDRKLDMFREEVQKSFKDLKETLALEKDLNLIKAALIVRNILPSDKNTQV